MYTSSGYALRGIQERSHEQPQIVTGTLFGGKPGCSKSIRNITPEPNLGSYVPSTLSEIGETENDPLRIARFIDELENGLKYPTSVLIRLRVFTNEITSFYALNKRVPVNWEEYRLSGFPLLIPNDYVSGQLYRNVDVININDTSGFTFTSNGLQDCEFEFVLKNNKTDENFIHRISFNKMNWAIYEKDGETPGPWAYIKFDFDHLKRDSFINNFQLLSEIYYFSNNGEAPRDMNDFLKDEGILIKESWIWDSAPDSATFFEWGMDTSKFQTYFLQNGSDLIPVITVQNVDPLNQGEGFVRGVNYWKYTSKEDIPTNVSEPIKFISSDELASFYVSFTQS